MTKQGARHAARVLAVGTWAIATWLWGKARAAGQADDDAAGPVVLVVVGTGMAVVAVLATPILASPLTLAWLIAAGIAGHRRLGPAPETERDDNTPEAPAEDTPRPANTPSDADLLRVLARLIGTRNGVLLRDVVAALHQAGVPATWGIPELRAQCDRLGIPVKASIQVGKSTSKGIHREGLKAVIYPTLMNAEKPPLYWPSDLPPKEEASCD